MKLNPVGRRSDTCSSDILKEEKMLDHVVYPPEYDPRISPIYALNEIDVKAPAAVV